MKAQHSAVLPLLLFVVLYSVASGQQDAPDRLPIGNGVSLHFVERGEGDPIIFVHGLMDDYSGWLRQLEGFAKQDYRAIAYSRRYNYPNKNRLRANHSALVEADDLAAFIRNLKLPKAHIVGYSYGAYTALILALEHPELVRTLTLGEPPLVPWLTDLPGDKSEAGKMHLEKLMEQGINPTKAAFELGRDEIAMRTMFDCIGGAGAFERLPEFVKDKCRRNVTELKAIASSNAPYPFVDRKKVRSLAVPTLILSGSKSVAVAKYTDSELERLIPEHSRKRIVLVGATHIIWVQQPVQCRNAVLNFIRDK
ncbi:MAG: alpha/beta hydrolase [Planctomicrobium sp.]|jgi:non-heme chloroperoxidase|nr:alpha/beta hydrolase [Planctomicrobium sp.]